MSPRFDYFRKHSPLRPPRGFTARRAGGGGSWVDFDQPLGSCGSEGSLGLWPGGWRGRRALSTGLPRPGQCASLPQLGPQAGCQPGPPSPGLSPLGRREQPLRTLCDTDPRPIRSFVHSRGCVITPFPYPWSPRVCVEDEAFSTGSLTPPPQGRHRESGGFSVLIPAVSLMPGT